MMAHARTIIKLCLILLIVQSVTCDWKPKNKGRETLCHTPECNARGEEYKKNQNTKVNPCQDFYSFTCGNWHHNHPGPKYISEWNILYELNFEILNIIRKTFEANNFHPDETKFRHAKLIYQYCINIPQYPIKDAKEISREITKIIHAPANTLWDIHSKYLHLSGESPFFRTKILSHPQSRELPLVMVLEPFSAYGSIYHEENWKPEEKHAYTEFLFRIMKSLKLRDYTDAVIRGKVEKVFQFRENLNRIILQNKKRYPDGLRLFTGQELDNWFLQNLKKMTNNQKLLWKDVIEALLQHVPADKRQTRDIITIRQKQYFFQLLSLFKSTSEEVLLTHMEIYFVERHLKFDERMYKLLEGTSIEPHSFYNYIRVQNHPRWHMCIDDLNVKETLEKLLYRKWFSEEYADTIRAMNGRIKTAIKEQMGKSSWLDKLTREATMSRIKNVEEWIGFPPWIDENSFNTAIRRRHDDDVLTAQAYLTRGSNVLYVHAPLLLPPVFSRTIPLLYNYAGIGSTLGHELYHVINDCGQYELDGRKIVWWEPAIRNECIKRKQQFIDVYNKITEREFQNRYNIHLKSDTSVSVLENLPDVMGLEAAYNAYKALELKEKSICQTLPHFEMYNCDQMFFIAYANTYCGFSSKKQAEKRIVDKATHSLDSIRINGAVAQMKDFGTTFGCPVGSPMNPQEKLDLWQ